MTGELDQEGVGVSSAAGFRKSIGKVGDVGDELAVGRRG